MRVRGFNNVGKAAQTYGSKIVALRFDDHETKLNVGSCWLKSLTGFNFAHAQQHATRCTNGRNMYHPTMLGVVGQESCLLLHGALLGKKEGKRGITGLNRQEDSPETSSRLSVMPWGAKRIPE